MICSDGTVNDSTQVSSSRTGFFERIAEAQRTLDEGHAGMPAYAAAELNEEAAAVLAEVAGRMHDNYPYAHPLYAGQMLKPPHPIARAAYTLAMSVNPNNHALDGGRASSALELEAVAGIAEMFGMGAPGSFLGHLTSGGTFANLEALWVAGQVMAGKIVKGPSSGKPHNEEGTPDTASGRGVAASSQAHYTHTRISGVLGLPFVALPVDERNRIDLAALEGVLEAGLAREPSERIGTVVATLGTTATGSVDPLDKILELRERYGFRVHVDAAYGGYFRLARNLEPETRAAYDAIGQADSVVVDPHKHGLQPYGCGCVLFANPGVGRLYKHDSPFTYFTKAGEGGLHLGEITLECSRAGASAVALWSTMRLLPLTVGGEFAKGLERGREAALELHRRVSGSNLFVGTVRSPELDIVVWAVAGEDPEESSARAQAVFDEAAKRDLHLALARLPVALFAEGTWARGGKEYNSVLCLRSVMMKGEHLDWIDAIWQRLAEAAGSVITTPLVAVPRKYGK